MSESGIGIIEVKSHKSKTKHGSETGSPFENIPHKTTKVSAPKPAQGHPGPIPLPDNHLTQQDNHGRDLTVKLSADNTHALWGGSYEIDVFGARTRKGVVMNPPPYVEPDPYNTVHTIGLMDEGFAERIVATSKMMRLCGLPTEAPRSFDVLEEILVENTDGSTTKVSIDEWKAREIKRIETEIGILPDNSEDRIKKEQFLTNVKKYFNDVEFVAMTRDVQINCRLEDIMTEIKKGNLVNTMEPILKWLNTVMKVKGRGLIKGSPVEKPFTTSPGDLTRYFSEYYPSQSGAYLGTMRENGFASTFLHPGNWQGVPTVLDLDSFRGYLIDGLDSTRLPTTKDFATDLYDTANNIGQLFQRLKENNSLGDVDYDRLLNRASYLFFKNYFKSAFGKRLDERVIDEMVNSEKRRNFDFPAEQVTAIGQLTEEVKSETGFVNRFIKNFFNRLSA